MTVAARKPTKRELALTVLRQVFINNDTRAAGEMKALCRELGRFSYRTMTEAKEELGILSERIGDRDGYWQWRWPDRPSNGSTLQVLPATYNGALPAKRCPCGPNAILDRDHEWCLKCGSLAPERS